MSKKKRRLYLMLKKEDATPIGRLYIRVQKEMDKKYGDAVVLMEIGKFYEVYTFENVETGEEVGKAKQMSRICNIQLTRKNKNVPLSFANPHMCGFPSHSLPRFVSHLVENGKTVVVYDQNEGEKGKLDRKVKAVYSPSVMVGIEDEEIQEKERSILAVETSWVDKRVLVVLVHVNTSSGKVFFEEEWLDEPDARTFLMGLVEMSEPSEVLFRGSVLSDSFCQCPLVHKIPEWTKDNKKFTELEFQEETLKKIYNKDQGFLSVIEEIGLERNPDVIPLFCYALKFLYDHLPLVVYRLERPVRLCRSGVVSFHPRCLYDLNIFSKKGDQESLFGLLDQTVTPGGKKLLRKKMFSPVYDVQKISSLHREIENFLSLEDRPELKKALSFYHIDLEHHFRRLQMGSISVLGMYRILTTCIELQQVVEKLEGLDLAKEASDRDLDWKEMLYEATETWDLNLLQSWRSWDGSTVWRVTPENLRECEEEWLRREKDVKDWIREKMGSDLVSRLSFSEDEAFLQITKKMFVEMKRPEGIRHKAMSSGTRVYHKVLDEFCIQRRKFLHHISLARKKQFLEEVARFLDRHESTLRFALEFTARFDLIQCYAKNVQKYRLSRPTLVVEEETRIECRQLRHLVVEAANPKNKYVPNDVNLSHILLFGQNSAGKCFKKGTLMCTWDGILKKVEDIRVGDRLIGDDDQPRTVLGLTRGYGKLLDVVNEETARVLMTVNEEHILCLTDPDRSKILEVRVKDILENPKKFQSFMFQCTARNKMDEFLYSDPPRTIRMRDRETYVKLLKRGFRLCPYQDDGIIHVLPADQDIVPFVLQSHGEGEYFGFGLDGNQRFLMPDGTLAHNSTLMKSVGVAVLMAQAGMFVPCEEMTFTPIHSLFTKIGTRDDIWKGKSTFITEMTELRHMVDRCNKHSLILCDEPTSGTETFSATGIVASSILTFLNKKSLFVMTTHLHTLKQFKELMEDTRLQIKHLGMEYDTKKKSLVFDRVLRDGFGKSIYGLEIAEYLGFSSDFLKQAYDFRSRLETDKTGLIPKKRSRYNSKKWVEKCEECGSTKELHTHHIEHQASADKDGYIGVFHKNRLSNLKILCRECHEKEHHHDDH